MPFKSKAQRAFLYAKHPDVAAEFADKTPKGTKLPKKITDSQKKPTRPSKGKKK